MTLDYQIKRAIDLVLRSRRVVALTGAGMSTPSGIPDFRSPGSGLWTTVDPFEVASIYSFRKRPQDFYDWIQPIAKLTIEAEPNAAHIALTQLEMYGPLRAIITQNVDMLHGRAGSRKVLEVHGHFREMTCIRCYSVYPAETHMNKFVAEGEVPTCERCSGVLKPNTILFGEQLPLRILNEAKKQALSCDLMLVAGSSLEVVPASELPQMAVDSGARLLIVNLQPTHMDRFADVVIHADVVDVLPRLAAPFLEGKN